MQTPTTVVRDPWTLPRPARQRLLPMFVLAGCAAAQPSVWLMAPQPSRPDAVAFDPVRNVTLLARTAGGSKILEWDGMEARERVPAPDAVTTIYWIGVHPADGRRMLLGRNAQGMLFGTWRGTAWEWRPANSPVPLYGDEQFAWDERRQRLVGHQTRINSILLEFDGTQWTWQVMMTGPLQRYQPAFAWDPLGQRILLYGGGNSASDCWSWDGVAWTLVAANGPPSRPGRGSMAHAPHLGGMVVYGAANDPTATWVLRGSTWTQLPTANDPGGDRTHHLVADALGLLLVPRASTIVADVWRLQADWQKVPQLTTSDPRSFGAAAFDRVRGQIVLHGGVIIAGKDTQLWDGRWHDPLPNSSPSPRGVPMMAWSQINGRVLLYGGQSNVGPMLGDTWSWAGTDWVQHQPPNAPPPRLNAVMVEDPSGGVLLFGGYDGVAALGDHWLWNGANWTQLTPSPVPAPHFFAGAAYDPSVQRVLMVSASSAGTTDTWDWDGSVWTLREPARPASTNRQLRLAFDPQRGRVVMLDNLFYEWNGTTWQSLGAGPTAMYQPLALVTDTREGRALAVSSVTDPGVWRLARQPATVTAVGSGCALAPAGVPGLSLLGEPRFPQSGFAFELTGVLPSGLALLAIGSDRLDVPLGGGCTSHVRVPFTMLLAVADAQGVARTPMPIPDNPALRGAQVVAQGLSLDAVHSPFGVGTLTPALAIVVGD